MWAATAAHHRTLRTQDQAGKGSSARPAHGRAGSLIFALPDAELHHSGHRVQRTPGRGLILAILLGPYAGFLVMAAILAVQALFFADGGLLALGCNIFNLGFFSCLVAYPFIYKPLAGGSPGTGRITLASITAAVIGLQLGAFSVVLETTASGISALPFAQFVQLMLPIHLAIGVVEGLATAAVVIFISKAQPSLLRLPDLNTELPKRRPSPSWASLRWPPFSAARPSPGSPPPTRTAWNGPWPESRAPRKRAWRNLRHPTAIWNPCTNGHSHPADDALPPRQETVPDTEPASLVNPETSLAGILGSAIIAALIFLAGFLFGRKPHEDRPR